MHTLRDVSFAGRKFHDSWEAHTKKIISATWTFGRLPVLYSFACIAVMLLSIKLAE